MANYQPALIGGLVMGVLSALPIVSVGNVCCCLWVVSGGLVASYLQQQRQSTPLTAADGATVGLLAGLTGAVVFVLVSIPLLPIVLPLQRRLLEGQPELQELATSAAGTALGVVASFIAFLIAGAVFSTLGGLLGAAIFSRSHGPASEPPPA